MGEPRAHIEVVFGPYRGQAAIHLHDGVLQPLIEGLKSRGFCFATLRDHPQYTAAGAVR